MALLARREQPPQPVRELLEQGERVVAFADSVVATNVGLWWPNVDGPPEIGWHLIGWHLISKAIWRDDVLSVIECDVVDDLLICDRSPVRLRLTLPRNLPEIVRTRVQASVAHSEVAAVEGGTVRFVARRVPGRDGLSWWARLESGAIDSAPLREAVALRLERLRAGWTPAGS